MEDTRITIWAMGFGHSGTHWLSWLLGDALDSPVAGPNDSDSHWAPDGGDRPGPYLVRHINIEPWADGPIVLIVRDPRDVMASQMQYWNHSFERRLKGLKRWSQYNSIWSERAAAVVRYEDLQKDCADALAWVLTDAGIPFDPERVSGACWRQRFEAKKNWKSEGRWVPNNFFYRGKVGNWKKDLTAKQAQIITDANKEMMERFGYE